MAFISIHSHGSMSLRDGIGDVEEWAKWHSDNGLHALAQTNHGNISVFYKQYEACKKYGLLPIFGVEAYIINNRKDLIPHIGVDTPESVEKRKELAGKRSHILLLAKNYEGLKNLFKITSLAYIESFYKFPLVDFDLIKEHKSGIIVSTACSGSEFAKTIMEDYDAGVALLKKYKDEFGDDFAVEIMAINYDHQKKVNELLYKAAKELGIKPILTIDAHYPNKEDSVVHSAILLMQSKKTFAKGDEEEKEVIDNEETEEKFWEFSCSDLYLKTEKEVLEYPLWEGCDRSVNEECVANVAELVSKIEAFEIDKTVKLPVLYEDSNKALRAKVISGLKSRPIPKDKFDIYKDRVMHEYKVIKSKGFSDYFLIIEDLVSWCKNKYGKDSVGVGRGSAGGSLMAYLLKITDIDPIKHNLLFSRFLDVGRANLSIKRGFCGFDELTIKEWKDEEKKAK